MRTEQRLDLFGVHDPTLFELPPHAILILGADSHEFEHTRIPFHYRSQALPVEDSEYLIPLSLMNTTKNEKRIGRFIREILL